MVVGSTIISVLYFCICIRTSKGPLFEMFLFLVIVVDRDCINLFQNTRIIFSCGEWVGWKSKNIFILFYLLSLKWTVLFCSVLHRFDHCKDWIRGTN